MRNSQNPMFMNPNLGNQQGMPSQQGLGYDPQGMPQGMNFPQAGYPGGAFPPGGVAGYPYPVQQQMMEDDCGCGGGHDDNEGVMSAGFNPYSPGMAPQMMAPHGPHGPGCGCGHHHGPMASPGMMGGLGPHGANVAPGMMGGFGPQGPAVGPMGGFGPQGPMMNPEMMGPQGPGATQGMMGFGPHGPGCGCGHHHGPMAGPGMMGGFGPGMGR